MNILGIITEYNPFHYGHLYHLQKAKEISNSDTIICIMNGNFVQRGKLALLDKWSRTKMALANGVDMVIELPLIYGIRSAEYFAEGSIKILNDTGIVNKLVFGSETGNINPLKEASKLLKTEDAYFQQRLQKYLSTGKSFPHARAMALKDYLNYLPYDKKLIIQELEKTLNEPNNILGIEYLKALDKYNSKIEAYTIKREGSGYHEQELQEISSATAIRKKIYENGFSSIKNYLPEESYQIIAEDFQNKKLAINKEYFSMMLLANLRQRNSDNLREFAEIENGLENRIVDQVHKSASLQDLIDKIKTKAFTRTRIQRNLLHIFFNIKEVDFKELDSHGPQYIRVLGIKKTRKDLLSKISKKSQIPVVINPSQYMKEVSPNNKDPLIKSLSYDIIASDIYSLLYKDPKYRNGHLDFTMPLIKV
ncbi:nucleotidyltransferase [Natronospora cellulosivora (SeqCode)]